MYVLWFLLFVIPMAVFGLALLAVIGLVVLAVKICEVFEPLITGYDDSYDG